MSELWVRNYTGASEAILWIQTMQSEQWRINVCPLLYVQRHKLLLSHICAKTPWMWHSKTCSYVIDVLQQIFIIMFLYAVVCCAEVPEDTYDYVMIILWLSPWIFLSLQSSNMYVNTLSFLITSCCNQNLEMNLKMSLCHILYPM